MEDSAVYEVSDLDEEYEGNDKILLDKMRQSSARHDHGNEEEVFAFDSEDEDELYDDVDENDDKSDIDMGSDFNDDDKLPDDRAWGTKRKNFYNTDYVDQDYAGLYKEKEIETAELEEQEARNIQKRLMEQLNDADFSISEFSEKSAIDSATIRTDLSQLTKRQKRDLFYKEAPEFNILVEDFNLKIKELRDRINPMLKLVENGKLPQSRAVDYLKIKRRVISNYCANIACYLMLKAKRIPIKDHPVLKALFRYRQILNQLVSTDENIIDPQIDVLIQHAELEKKVLLLKTKKKRLSIIKKLEGKKIATEAIEEVSEEDAEEGMSYVENTDSTVGLKEKRAITYEMAKNKGLTPKRSKEQRNPRVKHRKKYRKAMIRRRGQVRTAKTEIPVYGGEPTGIKIGLTKSRKLK